MIYVYAELMVTILEQLLLLSIYLTRILIYIIEMLKPICQIIWDNLWLKVYCSVFSNLGNLRVYLLRNLTKYIVLRNRYKQ